MSMKKFAELLLIALIGTFAVTCFALFQMVR